MGSITKPKELSGRRATAQRRILLDLIQQAGDHVDADELYRRARSQEHSISLSTVYRNLNILVEQDKVRRIVCGSTFDRYDAKTEQHYHFICQECRLIMDVEMPFEESLNERINSTHRFKAVGHQIQFFGICETCLNV